MEIKLKIFIVFLLFFSKIFCFSNNYNYIYNKKVLTMEDCKNTELVKWILSKEIGIKIKNEIKIITTSYLGGIPLQIENFPIYYIVEINEKEFKEYKKQFLNSKYWRYFDDFDSIVYLKDNKFELGCKIENKKIIFGFRNVIGIAP